MRTLTSRLALILSFPLSLVAAPASAASYPLPAMTLSVDGSHSVEIIADQATVTVGIESFAGSAEEAQSQLANIQQRVLEVLRDEQLKANTIETKHLSIHPRFRGEDRNLIGFQGHATISFSCHVSDAGHLMNVALSSGATENLGYQVTPSKELRQVARAQALAQAARNALAEGKIMLDVLGLDFEEIYQITIDPVPSHTPIFRAYGQESAATKGTLEITPQDVSVTARVTLLLSYRN